MEDTVRVRCPYCREWVDLYVDPDTRGMLVEDCAVCCRPWAVTIERDGVRVFVDPKSYLYLLGTEIVYESTLMAFL